MHDEEEEEQLDAQQRACVNAPPGHLLISATPGSGKTRTLVSKVQHLIKSGVSPERIVVVTFTNKAASELKHRLQCNRVKCGTFHALALQYLQAHQYGLFADEFTMVTNNRAPQTFFNKYLRSNCLNVQQHGAAMAKAYALYRTSHAPPIPAVASIPASVVSKCFHAYQADKRHRHEVDYDDLLHYWHEWLTGVDADTLDVSHLFVDEAQDCNNIQFDIVLQHAAKRANVVAVGDADQSIYGFRGSNVNHILTLVDTLPGAQHCNLEYNYRSTPEICFVAKCIIDFNGRRVRKQLTSMRPSGRVPCLYPFETVIDEHRFVADVCTRALRDGTECAVLCRTNREVQQLESVLNRRAITYCLLKGMNLFDQPHVKQLLNLLIFLFTKDPSPQCVADVLAMHRQVAKAQAHQLVRTMMADTEADSLALVFLEQPALPPTLQVLQQALMPLHAALRDMAAGAEYAYSSYSTQVTAVALHHVVFIARPSLEQHQDLELIGDMRAGYTSFDEFLAAVHLGTLQVEQQHNSLIKLGTIHQAKGLEFECVVVTGCVNGNIPSALAKSAEEVEEERRLLYVAATRAQEQLCFTFALQSSQYAEKAQSLSCFLMPLINHLVIKQNKQLAPPGFDPSCATLEELLSDFYRCFGRHNLLVNMCQAQAWREVDVGLTPCPLALHGNTANSHIQAGPTSCLLMKRIIQECVRHPECSWVEAATRACHYIYGQHSAECRIKRKLLTGDVSDKQVAKHAWPQFMAALQQFVDRLLAGKPETLWVARPVAHQETGVETTVDLLLDHTLFCFVFDLHISASALLLLHLTARVVGEQVTTLVQVNLFTGKVTRLAVEPLGLIELPLLMQTHPLVELLSPLPVEARRVDGVAADARVAALALE
jgi:DNA helicase-2/ATP-dependent DNA helicase PcrA